MNMQSVIFIVIAILVTFCITLIGVALGEENLLLGIVALLGAFILMGVGFSVKRKFRNSSNS
ncbi:DUF5325 family protein [Alkalihalobacillus sp. AL-G]|uniref:DUF5325 family protein n=1 Tax=Alkalihalobacillus sp. AL-G TaxID=2926399 RepID=UPI00272D8151|nr:DUF5325 family protein [Alkalihalobacillus sp. AL-G]WLD95013.1 YlaF family protein [Alkalihalobacillus sp. AL-G]